MSDTQYKSIKAIGVAEEQNQRFRLSMEDLSIFHDCLCGDESMGFFAVFDGHGGVDAAVIAAEKLPKFLTENINNNFHLAIKAAISETDHYLAEKEVNFCGCTYVGVIIARNHGKNGKLYFSNVGDSRSVLSINGEAVRCSLDHTPNEPSEFERLSSSEAGIIDGRVDGVLSVSRALGDHLFKKHVISTPFQSEYDITDQTEFIILACDGVWDVVTDQKAVDLVREYALRGEAKEAAEALRNMALESGSTDNISCMLICL